ncbi:hypothetical protein DCC81_11505 [Chitinophaga parva]|uniref:Uncharacterized protein n=1 Tax=Chitinophaga parva TaxID=2169414 RepID=A0A2T7BF68_9BACT|nr:hypothetical protein DCC81_11505 [Chitinophaga parva]
MVTDIFCNPGTSPGINRKNITSQQDEIKLSEQLTQFNLHSRQNRNQFLVSPGYSNDLYEIDTNKNVLHKKYSIDLGKYRLPNDFATKYPTFISFDKGLGHSNYAYITDYWDTPNYLVYSFSYKGLIYDVYYSKRTKQIRYGNAWFNNVYGIIVGANKGAYDDNIIAVYDPANIESYQKSLITKRTKEQTDSLLQVLIDFII